MGSVSIISRDHAILVDLDDVVKFAVHHHVARKRQGSVESELQSQVSGFRHVEVMAAGTAQVGRQIETVQSVTPREVFTSDEMAGVCRNAFASRELRVKGPHVGILRKRRLQRSPRYLLTVEVDRQETQMTVLKVERIHGHVAVVRAVVDDSKHYALGKGPQKQIIVREALLTLW